MTTKLARADNTIKDNIQMHSCFIKKIKQECAYLSRDYIL